MAEYTRLRAKGTTGPGVSDWDDEQWTCPCGCVVYGKAACCGRSRVAQSFASTQQAATQEVATGA